MQCIAAEKQQTRSENGHKLIWNKELWDRSVEFLFKMKILNKVLNNIYKKATQLSLCR